jgi:hypothetical protein
MILFSAIELDECTSAYHWHRGFVGANDALYPRQHDDFQSLVMDGSVWAAKSLQGDYLAMAYASFDEAKRVCELGGLMVVMAERGKGLGATIMRLALAHVLVEENLLSIPGVRIVSHVIEGNTDPLTVIEHALRFRKAGPVKYPAKDLPGLRARDGYVHGEEFEITVPESVQGLAEWARAWNGEVNGGTAHIELRAGVAMRDWAETLDAIARGAARPAATLGHAKEIRDRPSPEAGPRASP